MFTRKESLAQAIVLAKASKNAELIESLEHMLAVESKARKESPKQKENKILAAAIVEHFKADATPLTISELIETGIFKDAKEPVNVPRVTRLCSNLIEEGHLQKFKERRATLFTVAE